MRRENRSLLKHRRCRFLLLVRRIASKNAPPATDKSIYFPFQTPDSELGLSGRISGGSNISRKTVCDLIEEVRYTTYIPAESRSKNLFIRFQYFLTM
jgi:hypothetical protein